MRARRRSFSYFAEKENDGAAQNTGYGHIAKNIDVGIYIRLNINAVLGHRVIAELREMRTHMIKHESVAHMNRMLEHARWRNVTRKIRAVHLPVARDQSIH